LYPKRVTLRLLALFAAALWLAAAGGLSPAAAQKRAVAAQARSAAAPGGTIADIRIEGIQRIEPETVRS